VTDTSGTARFPALTPGNYEVAFNLEGFAPVAAQKIVLRIGQEAKLSAVMQAASSETITVTAEAPIVDVHKTDSSTNIIPEQIATSSVSRSSRRASSVSAAVSASSMADRSSARAATPRRPRSS
jgi:hypothetical protein